METATRGALDRRAFLKHASAATSAAVMVSLVPRMAWAAASVVETSNGKVRGSVYASASGSSVHVFKGMRYGDTTGGEYRFLPPRPPRKWSGIQDATQWGASCPQVAETQDPFYAWYTAIQPTNEDCLFLNVFTPGVNDNKRRPIMVWLHGGSWSSCAGTAPGFDGTNLAAAQDVVVVTVNHRLNAFGYLWLEDKDERFADAGSAGVLDILQALRWVRDNAAAFGGDAGNVTVFGQSGGAAKVIALMGMPAAQGLFHKAIVQSCSGGMRIDSPDEAARQAHALASALDMQSVDGAALQQVPMDKLVAALKRVADPFRPVVDGRNFLRDPYYPDAPAMSAHIPLLIGNANTESTYYLQVDPNNFSLGMADVQRRLQHFLKTDAARVDALVEAYRSEYPAYDPSEILMTITTDYLFKRNTLKVASLQAAAGQAPVYAYVFARQTPIQGGRIHTPHTGEVPFIFGTAKAAEAQVGTGADIEPMTRRIMATWATFARTGNPGNSTLPHWAPYRDGDRQTMALSMDSQLLKDPGGGSRGALEGLPYYEYSVSRSAFVKG
ncbi:hypothetical protein CAL26_02145 [Bordetella genomosp. 9]|uniref:Carboxylic ester hydrolase n=1 Tax=Bordetella genomosp. 9 TaxID=1416803 RepID=A0A261RM76_9BORD|nr:carboxylesterase family protein [Bordetella genomosp. 9]OZI26168.1 hypothetical protein CAL26_02145 [Bordetella genomosp. 9]